MKFLGKVFLHDILNGILAVSAASPHGMGEIIMEHWDLVFISICVFHIIYTNGKKN